MRKKTVPAEPPSPPPTPPEPRRKQWTKAEVREHMDVVERLLLMFLSDARLVALMRKEHGLLPQRTRQLVVRVRERWAREEEALRPTNKATDVRRVEKLFEAAAGRRNPDGTWAEKPDHAACARYLHMLAQLRGTYDPVRVETTAVVGEALAGVISQLTSARSAELLSEYAEIERQAQAYRELPPGGGNH